MSDSITVLAPAKINLGLEIYPRRADGYHGLHSIFTTVGLFDEICVSKIDEKNTCIVDSFGMDLPNQNTITAAYKAFCVLTGIDLGVHVSIKKRIPSGGGLGGGSSDASSFIQSVNNLFKAGLGIDSLSAIAGKVGSDVFFFKQVCATDLLFQQRHQELPALSSCLSLHNFHKIPLRYAVYRYNSGT